MYKVQLIQNLPEDDRCRRHFSLKMAYNRFWDMMGKCPPCRSELFPYIFMLVLSMSFYGAYCSICELVNLHCHKECPMDMWRPRKFMVIELEVLRRARYVGAFIAGVIWVMVIFAMINMEPAFMTPFMVLNTILLGIDIILWLIDAVNCGLPVHWCTVYPLVKLFCVMAMVNCIQKVFEMANKRRWIDALSIFGRN